MNLFKCLLSLILIAQTPAFSSVSSQTSRINYTASGSNSSYAYTFKIFDDDDLDVIVRLISTGVETTLTKTTHYTVSGVGSSSGGSVSLVNGSFDWIDAEGDLESGWAISIRRKLDIVQTTSLKNNKTYYPSLHENAFDKLTMIGLQHQDELDRTMKVPWGDTVVDLTLPNTTDRASKFLAFNSSGSPIASDGGISSSIPVSSFWETVLDDTSAANSFTTMGVSAFVQTLLDDASAAVFRATLGFSASADHVLINNGSGAPSSEATLAVSRGGTNTASYTSGDMIYASGATTLSKLGIGTNGYFLGVASGAPAWVERTDQRNRLLNAGFYFWQWGTSTTVANGGTGYQADRWYVKNSLGTNGVITYSRVAGGSDGAAYGASVKITTAPTAVQANGTELYQTLENPQSLQFYNKTASFSAKVKALGNVNQVGVQFFYKTTEAKVDTAIGSESTCAVDTSSFATCSINGQAMGSSMTSAGVVGVRIRITTVSSGNTYDLNNGFIVENAMMNTGSYPAPFMWAESSVGAELTALQRFYEKSYPPGTAPGTATGTGLCSTLRQDGQGTGLVEIYHLFRVPKRVTPTIGFYDFSTNSSKVAYYETTSLVNNRSIGGQSVDSEGFHIYSDGATSKGGMCLNFAVSAEI